eukprot:4047958-Amphidinium_carterae.2
MTKYLETVKIKKHSETIGLQCHYMHKWVAEERSTCFPNVRGRSKYYSTPRVTTPQPRLRVHRVPQEVRHVPEEATIDDYELIEEIASADPYNGPTSSTTTIMVKRQQNTSF